MHTASIKEWEVWQSLHGASPPLRLRRMGSLKKSCTNLLVLFSYHIDVTLQHTQNERHPKCPDFVFIGTGHHLEH